MAQPTAGNKHSHHILYTQNAFCFNAHTETTEHNTPFYSLQCSKDPVLPFPHIECSRKCWYIL